MPGHHEGAGFSFALRGRYLLLFLTMTGEAIWLLRTVSVSGTRRHPTGDIFICHENAHGDRKCRNISEN